MLLNEIFDRGDTDLRNTWEQRRKEELAHKAKMNSYVKGFWLLDKKSAKKLSGPFKSFDAAESFKTNRSDKIPADAVIKEL